jgi:NAD(P)-dependent dehydrogenase (short-subunit alcohol dehydrogenase family)
LAAGVDAKAVTRNLLAQACGSRAVRQRLEQYLTSSQTAAELSPHVRISGIAPLLIETPLAKFMLSNGKMAEAIASLHPLPRLGDPHEIAGLAQCCCRLMRPG